MKLTRFMPPVDWLKWVLAAALGLGLVACGDNDDGQVTTTLNASLSGDQEVPGVPTGALGSGTLSLDSPSRGIRGSIVLDGMTANAAHIHLGDVGVSGPIIVPLIETSPGTWSVPANAVLTESQATAFAAGGLYYNAHSTAFPNGEIRGQIGRDVFVVPMTPAQEVPPPISTATGTGVLNLDPATRKFTARVAVSGMVATAAHIHAAAIGVNGPIIFPLSETAAGSGVWVSAPDAILSEAELTTLRAGGLYFNAHSVAFPNGEIRGQIGRNVGFARLTGSEEVPPTASTATATGMLVIDPATRAASGRITVSGMATTAAHVHQAAPGVNGPIIVPLTDAGGNVWNVPANARLSAEQLTAFKQGNLYYNAHSAQFPNGEIRGQIRAP
ncbi:MAG TPA: CHRD domain-containing protein [Ramlibacter sp.]|nr:CHRD domain-containing protein [Ramlibacter sp.]